MKIVVIARMRFTPEQMPQVREAVRVARAATIVEDGCIQYAFAEDLDEPGLLRVSEIWESRAALNAHTLTPHVAQWRATVGSLGMIERDVRVFTVASEEAL